MTLLTNLPRSLLGPQLRLLTHLRLTSTASESKQKILFEQNLRVPTFGGSLWAKSPFDVRVGPLGAHEYPSMDRALIKVRTSEDSLNKTDVKVKVSQEGHKLSAKTENVNVKYSDFKQVVQTFRLPIVHNINVIGVGNADIQAEGFIESDYCHLQSEDGDIIASEIKSGTIAIESTSGDVLCSGNIQGRITVKTMRGNVIGDKRITGQALEVATDSGDIRLASCYSETSKFSTNSGSMNLRNLHNESYIAVYEKGDVHVQGLDGSANIFVKKGDAICQISRIRAESRIHVEEGDITVRISDQHPIKISIEANDVFPDAKFKQHGSIEEGDGSKTFSCSLQPEKFSPHIMIIAENGNVNLESQDWAASLGLKMPISYGQGSHIQFEINQEQGKKE